MHKKTPHPQGRRVSRYHPDFTSAGAQRLASAASAMQPQWRTPGRDNGAYPAWAYVREALPRAISLQLEGHFPPGNPMPPFHQLRLSVFGIPGVLVLVTVITLYGQRKRPHPAGG
jgi:hypothetical protein